MTIWNIERKILNNAPLSAEEMGLVNKAINSEQIAEKVLACEALLRLGDTQQRNCGVTVLSKIVDDANAERERLNPNIVMAFFSLPWPVLKEPAFQACLKRAASCPDEGVRANSAVALGRLAKRGEAWAICLLEAAKKDPSAVVRQNAESSLSLTRKSSPPEGTTSSQ
jgi:hypothetical protein